MSKSPNHPVLYEVRPGCFRATLGADLEANARALRELEVIEPALERRVILSRDFDFSPRQLQFVAAREWITAMAYEAPPGVRPEQYFAGMPSLASLVVEQDCIDLSSWRALRHVTLGCGNSVSSLRLPATLESCEVWGLTDIVLEALRECQDLVRLVIKGTSISDISPLAMLSRLSKLEIGAGRRLADLAPLGTLKELDFLEIAECPKVRDWSFLSLLPKLRRVFIMNCREVDLDRLQFNADIEQIFCFECRVRGDVTALASRYPLARITID